MPKLPKHEMTADEFVAWLETAPREGGKFELIDGIVMQQHRERIDHAEVKAALFSALRDALKQGSLDCHVLVDGPLVRVRPKKVYKPDGLVYCGARPPPGVFEVASPLIVYEVLSPGSEDHDFGEKLVHYREVASLRHYLIADPKRRFIIHHARGEGDAWITRIVNHKQKLALDPPGIQIAIGEVFERA
jgi:Uma2 family endonuclease